MIFRKTSVSDITSSQGGGFSGIRMEFPRKTCLKIAYKILIKLSTTLKILIHFNVIWIANVVLHGNGRNSSVRSLHHTVSHRISRVVVIRQGKNNITTTLEFCHLHGGRRAFFGSRE